LIPFSGSGKSRTWDEAKTQIINGKIKTGCKRNFVISVTYNKHGAVNELLDADPIVGMLNCVCMISIRVAGLSWRLFQPFLRKRTTLEDFAKKITSIPGYQNLSLKNAVDLIYSHLGGATNEIGLFVFVDEILKLDKGLTIAYMTDPVEYEKQTWKYETVLSSIGDLMDTLNQSHFVIFGLTTLSGSEFLRAATKSGRRIDFAQTRSLPDEYFLDLLKVWFGREIYISCRVSQETSSME